MKIPKRLLKNIESPVFTAPVLRDAARALEIEAAEYRKMIAHIEAYALKHAAAALRAVAAGKSWAEAFDWEVPK